MKGEYTKTAAEFRARFVPVEGGNYQWIEETAAERYAALLSIYNRLDDKASSIVTYIGSAAGLIATGVTFGVSKRDITIETAGVSLVPLMCALGAVVCATLARTTRIHRSPAPSTRLICDYYASYGEEARAMLMPIWNAAESGMVDSNTVRSTWVNRALWCTVGAVACLALPIAAALVWPAK